jgi:hypothetical protein
MIFARQEGRAALKADEPVAVASTVEPRTIESVVTAAGR